MTTWLYRTIPFAAEATVVQKINPENWFEWYTEPHFQSLTNVLNEVTNFANEGGWSIVSVSYLPKTAYNHVNGRAQTQAVTMVVLLQK